MLVYCLRNKSLFNKYNCLNTHYFKHSGVCQIVCNLFIFLKDFWSKERVVLVLLTSVLSLFITNNLFFRCLWFIFILWAINELSIRKGHATLTRLSIKKLTAIIGFCKALNYPSKYSLGLRSIRGCGHGYPKSPFLLRKFANSL